MATPTPLKTILSADRYPFAVAYVEEGAIKYTVGYEKTLEDVYFSAMGWNQSLPRNSQGRYIMSEMSNLDDTESYSYWVAV